MSNKIKIIVEERIVERHTCFGQKHIGKKTEQTGHIKLLFNFQLQKQLHDEDHADGLHGQRVRQVGGRGQRDHQDVPERVG